MSLKSKHQMYYKLNPDKTFEPCSMKECNDQLMEMIDNNTKNIGLDNINGKYVSTVWLGIDHQYEYNRPPLLFETMVFGKTKSELYCKRYQTYKEALEGHKKAIEWVEEHFVFIPETGKYLECQ